MATYTELHTNTSANAPNWNILKRPGFGGGESDTLGTALWLGSLELIKRRRVDTKLSTPRVIRADRRLRIDLINRECYGLRIMRGSNQAIHASGRHTAVDGVQDDLYRSVPSCCNFRFLYEIGTEVIDGGNLQGPRTVSFYLQCERPVIWYRLTRKKQIFQTVSRSSEQQGCLRYWKVRGLRQVH